MNTTVQRVSLPVGIEGYIRLAGLVFRAGLSEPRWLESDDGQWWMSITGANASYLKRKAKQYHMEGQEYDLPFTSH